MHLAQRAACHPLQQQVRRCAHLGFERQLRVQRLARVGQCPLAARLRARRLRRHWRRCALRRLLCRLASLMGPLLPLRGRPRRRQKHSDGAANAPCNVHTASVGYAAVTLMLEVERSSIHISDGKDACSEMSTWAETFRHRLGPAIGAEAAEATAVQRCRVVTAITCRHRQRRRKTAEWSKPPP